MLSSKLTIAKTPEQSQHEAEKKLSPQTAHLARKKGSFKRGNKSGGRPKKWQG